MSSRTNIRPYPVITNGDMSGTITSSPTVLQSVSGVSYAVSWTGTSPVGSLSLEGSNDYSLHQDGTVNNSGTWTTLEINVNGTPATSISISGNSGNGIIDVTKTMVYATRIIYTSESGIGTLQAIINGKVS